MSDEKLHDVSFTTEELEVIYTLVECEDADDILCREGHDHLEPHTLSVYEKVGKILMSLQGPKREQKMELEDKKYYWVKKFPTSEPTVGQWTKPGPVNGKGHFILPGAIGYYYNVHEVIGPCFTPDEVEERCGDAYECGLTDYPMGW